MIRFRGKRAQDLFDGLCERDAARLRAFFAQGQPIPGREGPWSRATIDVPSGAHTLYFDADNIVAMPAEPKRKRGRRA